MPSRTCGPRLLRPPGAQVRDKPSEPTPEDFGLSWSRVRQLVAPERLLLERRYILIPALAAAFIVGLLLAAWYEGVRSDRVVGTLVWVVLVVGAVTSIALRIAIRLEPDYPSFRTFMAARQAYPAVLREWVREREEWIREQEDFWLNLDGHRFELELSSFFQRRGYSVSRIGGSGDGGIDLTIQRGDHSILVQCKAHRKPVGPAAVRDLYGALMHHGAAEAWLISTRGFSNKAMAFAAGKPLQLLTIRDLLEVPDSLPETLQAEGKEEN